MKRSFVVGVSTFCIFSFTSSAWAQADVVEAEMVQTVRSFADGLNTISEMQKAKASNAQQVAAICPIVADFFDMTYVHGESVNWIKLGNPGADIDKLSRTEQEKLLVAYFAVSLIKNLKPLFEVLLTHPYQYTLIQSRKPVDKKTQEYVQHDREIVFKFRNDPAAKAFIAFMTPGRGSLIRTSTISDMYGKNTLTSLGARALRNKSVADIKKVIQEFTGPSLATCP